MKRILITGASGFVGRLLTRHLQSLAGVEALLPLGGPDMRADQTVDLLDIRALDRAVQEFAPTDIVHLAAASSVAAAGQSPERAWDINFVGVRNLATSARALRSSVRLVFASTAEVYGRAFLAGDCSECTTPQPVSTYARTKLAAEHLLEDLAGGNLKVSVLRLFNHTGPGQDTRFVVPSFAAQVARAELADAGGRLHVGNLEARRDFSDVEDILRAYSSVILGAADDLEFVRYNVGSGRVRSVQSIVDLLVQMASRPIVVVTDPSRMRPSEIAVAGGIFDRFRDRYRWSAMTPFETTVANVLEAQRTLAMAMNGGAVG